MLVGTNTITNLSAAINATQSTISVDSLGSLASMAVGDHAYLHISDGTTDEIVKVTGVSGGSFTVERGQFGTPATGFVKGVCVKPYAGYQFICELIAQGGCQATTVTACTAVSLGATSIPDAVIGKSWTGVVAFANSTAVNVVSKPAWVTATVTGGTVLLTGTPPAGSVSGEVAIQANGCQNSVVISNKTINLCEQVGA